MIRVSFIILLSMLFVSSVYAEKRKHYLYKNKKVLEKMTSYDSKLQINLTNQRIKLFSGNQLALESQISTGTNRHRTPTGKFLILEKKVDKKSNLYGKWVKLPSGYAKFHGAPMPYWMRIIRGIGIHAGYVPFYAASHGCIRVPADVQPLIFFKTRVGTPVEIIY